MSFAGDTAGILIPEYRNFCEIPSNFNQTQRASPRADVILLPMSMLSDLVQISRQVTFTTTSIRIADINVKILYYSQTRGT